jgi:CBS domain containing-hemolysin-like protein
VPEEGEAFESHNARFTAVEATPTHVKRIRIEMLQPATDNGQRPSNGK